MGWNRLPAHRTAPDIIPAADAAAAHAAAVAGEQAAWLGAHYQEHRRIEVIPALGEAVAFSVCPDCRRWERAERVYASGGDEARAAVLMEVWR